MKKYISIDIGGTEIKYGLLSEAGVFIKSARTPAEAAKGALCLMEKVEGIIQDLLCADTAGIAVSTAGMVDPVRGRIIYANANIPGYTGMEIKKRLESVFHLPCEVENDVCCAGIAEYASGAAAGSSPAVCLTVGTGIGGCLLIEGQVMHGAGYTAGSAGYLHMPGGRCFEETASVTALVRRVAAQKQESADVWDGRKIFAAIEKQDRICIRAVDEMTDALGLGIADICYLLNPRVVVLGGGIMRQESYLLPRIRAAMDRYLVPAVADQTSLRAALHHNEAGMLGAFYHFLDRQRRT